MRTERIKTRFNNYRNSLLILLAIMPLMSLKGGVQSLSELEQFELECKIIKEDLELKDLQLETLKRIELVADSIYNLNGSHEIHITDTIITVIK